MRLDISCLPVCCLPAVCVVLRRGRLPAPHILPNSLGLKYKMVNAYTMLISGLLKMAQSQITSATPLYLLPVYIARFSPLDNMQCVHLLWCATTRVKTPIGFVRFL